MTWPVDPMVVGLLPHCEGGPLVRCCVVWDSMPVDLALCQTPAGVLAKS